MRDVCRNFQRGSCQYGERCKFLHAVQTQRKPNVHGFGGQNNSYQLQNTNNPFGFGSKAASVFASHQQQQKPNPFGFGSQNSSYSNAPYQNSSLPSMVTPLMWPEIPLNGNRPHYQQQWQYDAFHQPL